MLTVDGWEYGESFWDGTWAGLPCNVRLGCIAFGAVSLRAFSVRSWIYYVRSRVYSVSVFGGEI